jgi:hypothetical protein
MKKDWRTVDCLINCPSQEMLRQLEAVTEEAINLDRIITRTLVQGGETEKRLYRLGDYFDSIELTHDEPHNRVRLTFHARKDVDSHWKGLLMAVLRSIGNRVIGISVEFPRLGSVVGEVSIRVFQKEP